MKVSLDGPPASLPGKRRAAATSSSRRLAAKINNIAQKHHQKQAHHSLSEASAAAYSAKINAAAKAFQLLSARQAANATLATRFSHGSGCHNHRRYTASAAPYISALARMSRVPCVPAGAVARSSSFEAEGVLYVIIHSKYDWGGVAA